LLLQLIITGRNTGKQDIKVDFDTESLSLDENENITELGMEAPKLEDIDARYIGLLKFSKSGLEKITEILEKDYETYQDKQWKQSGKTIRKGINDRFAAGSN